MGPCQHLLEDRTIPGSPLMCSLLRLSQSPFLLGAKFLGFLPDGNVNIDLRAQCLSWKTTARGQVRCTILKPTLQLSTTHTKMGNTGATAQPAAHALLVTTHPHTASRQTATAARGGGGYLVMHPVSRQR